MESKIFVSDSDWFSIQIPVTWERYDDVGGTYAFFDATQWTGNLRISPLKWKPPKDKEISEEFLLEMAGENSYRIGEFYCDDSKNYISSDGEDFVNYNWKLIKSEITFICSFTTLKKNENTERNEIELKKVIAILESIKTK